MLLVVRRRLLVGLLPFVFFALSCPADEFDVLRTKWFDALTGGTNYSLTDPLVTSRISSITSSAQSYWNSMDKSASRTYLWSDLTSATVSGQIVSAYSRLRAMALAWATYGSTLRSNATLAADIQGGLDWMYANRYNETKTEYDNWYHWEIGAPLTIDDLAVLMYDGLGMAGLQNSLNTVESFTPSPTNHGRSGTFTGANLADRIRIVAVRGAIVKDANKLLAAREALSKLYPYVISGDGYYVDGSFVQHTRHPYTGGYGYVLLGDLAALLPWLKGSTWECVDPARTNVIRWVYDSYEPLVYKGAMMDMSRARGVSRSGSQDHAIGHTILQNIMILSDYVTGDDRARMRSMVKYWAQADSYRNFTNNVPLPLIPAAEQLMSDSATAARGELIGHWNFGSMDRVVHLRPGWGLAISMSSSRIYNYECINGENLHGWFQGDGMNYLYNSDLSQFSDDFWCTVDPYRMPGTTVETTTRANASGQSKSTSRNWVGGATLLTNGIAGMDLQPYGSSLTGRKSWFTFDNEIVCLGTGISCTSAVPVETIVENRKISTSNTNVFTLNGVTMPTTLGWSTNAAAVSWCALGGAGAYYFPGGTTIKALRQARTSSWSQVNTGGSSSSTTKNYLTLWFDHGTAPVNGSYAYALLPNYTATQVSNYAAAPEILVLENSTNVQAVKHTRLNLLAANFWDSVARTADLITCSGKASVLAQETPTDLLVALSDPTQTNAGTLEITLARSAASIVSADPAITVNRLSPTIQLTANMSAARGRSMMAQFRTVGVAPGITTQPLSQAVLAGQSVTFSAAAAGDAPLSWQWFFQSAPIPDATNASYTLPSAQVANVGTYSVQVTNQFGFAISSNAILTILHCAGYGDNSFGQRNVPAAASNLVAIAAGAYHSLGLRADGSIVAWGLNSDGQCSVPFIPGGAVAIAAGGYHTLAITPNGNVYAWGANHSGQSTVPAGLGDVIAVAAGTWHSLALRSDGTVVCWGDNTWGQASVPPGLARVIAIAAGGNHSLALKADGTVVAWGENTNASGAFTGQAIPPLGLVNVVSIGAGKYHSLAISGEGSVVAWGDNSQGQCGVPPSAVGVIAALGGGAHSLALTAGGSLVAWGADSGGQCDFPSDLTSGIGFAAGEAHTLVLLDSAMPVGRAMRPFLGAGRFSLSVQSLNRHFYTLEFKNALTQSNWFSLPAVPGNGALKVLVDPSPAPSNRFYRVHY